MTDETRYWAEDVSPGPSLVPVASECDLYGHDYEVRDREQSREEWSQARPRVPDRVVCPRCGLSWKVER